MVLQTKKMSANIYHERQMRELCALHALNNLFQAKGTYTKGQLDEICKYLSPDEWINPHRSLLGLGNYDINVIMTALQRKNCEAIWFDKRKDPACIKTSAVVGFILNVPTDYKFGFVSLPIKRRHWIAVREIGNNFYNLDSKLEAPLSIGSEDNLLSFLRSQLQSNDRELFIVVDTDSAQKWMKSDEYTDKSVEEA